MGRRYQCMKIYRSGSDVVKVMLVEVGMSCGLCRVTRRYEDPLLWPPTTSSGGLSSFLVVARDVYRPYSFDRKEFTRWSISQMNTTK